MVGQNIITSMTVPPLIPQEVEAKLLVPRAAVFQAITRLKRLGPYRLRPRRIARLHTIYLDTPEFTLAHCRTALRLRRHGTRWEASVKWEGQSDGIVYARPELTVQLSSSPSLPFRLPPGPLADQLSSLVAKQPLTPILISDVRRQRFAVFSTRLAEDNALAELALDEVHLRAPDPHTSLVSTYWEVEIELETNGTEQDLRTFVGLLQQRFSLTPSDGGKFHRGLALLYGPGLIASEATNKGLVSRQPRAAKRKAKIPTTQQ